MNYIYAVEADLLNVALFGKTAKEWREENPDKEGKKVWGQVFFSSGTGKI